MQNVCDSLRGQVPHVWFGEGGGSVGSQQYPFLVQLHFSDKICHFDILAAEERFYEKQSLILDTKVAQYMYLLSEESLNPEGWLFYFCHTFNGCT